MLCREPFSTHIKLDRSSSVPSPFRTPGTFTVTRLESSDGLPDRITKLSSVPALLVSISLKSLPLYSYQVWVADKVIPTPIIPPFRSNVIDFDSEPSCWAGKAFDYVHYTVPRVELDDIAACARSIQPDFGSAPASTVRCTPKNGQGFQRWSCSLAKAPRGGTAPGKFGWSHTANRRCE